MGKSWDNTGIAYNVELWKESLRVLKHGGHLLAFGGTRTYHRMACAIEDAGFEIRDQMQWIYGSGFPKSMDISKQIDKKLGAEREVVGKRIHPTLKNVPSVKSNAYHVETLESNENMESWDITAPSTDLAKQWEGWGTALKPANEPICVARKPISEKTIAENVIKWGVGGINIDDCRIGTEELTYSSKGIRSGSGNYIGDSYKPNNDKTTVQGRFPANIIFDEVAAKMLDKQSGVSKSSKGENRTADIKNQTRLNNSKEVQVNCEYNDIGGASRFFYCAKASKKERNDGMENSNIDNIHPTVKPISLMEYLVKLVTPPKGTCLDMFMGSGTTGIACKNLDINFIGIEKEETYYNIADNRIKSA